MPHSQRFMILSDSGFRIGFKSLKSVMREAHRMGRTIANVRVYMEGEKGVKVLHAHIHNGVNITAENK